MATNEHNPSLSNLLTAMSGSTINIVSEIDSAITDIQNYIDSTKTDINNSITASQNNIYSHISGSTISIDNFIDSAVTTINANVDSKTNNLTVINNALLSPGDTTIGLPNMNVGSSAHNKKCSTSVVEETIFYFNNPQYLFVQAWNSSDNTINAEVTIYYDTISTNNIIAHATIPPGCSEIVACFPALVNGKCFITAMSDGSHNVCVAVNAYTSTLATEVELTTIHNNKMNLAAPNTISDDPSIMDLMTYSGTQKIRQFIYADLSSIPSVAIVEEAYLDLVKYDDNDTDDFHIGITSEDAIFGQVTYNSRQTGVPWSVPGDGGGLLSPTPIFSGYITGDPGEHILFDITDTVKGWLDGSISNNGLILYIYPNHPVVYKFHGVTASASANRPRLRIKLL